MSKKFWNTSRFKDLKREWDDRLTDSGFNDIELNENILKQSSRNSYRTINLVLIESKQRYFELLGQGAHDEIFDSQVHRLVMEMRSLGMKLKDICFQLENIGEKRSRFGVMYIIKKYEHKWNIKKKA